jgi:hypothetical protein
MKNLIPSTQLCYEYLNDANDTDVENFFENDWKEIHYWKDGKGRATQNFSIYTDGVNFLLETESFGFEDYSSVYHFIKIKNTKSISMKKLICLSASIYFFFASFIIPYLFLNYTEPTGANLMCMCIMFTMSVFGCYAYFTTYMDSRKK